MCHHQSVPLCEIFIPCHVRLQVQQAFSVPMRVLQSRRNLTSGQIPAMNPLDEAAKESSARTAPVPSARDDYAIASPLQVVIDPQEGAATPHSVILCFALLTFCFALDLLCRGLCTCVLPASLDTQGGGGRGACEGWRVTPCQVPSHIATWCSSFLLVSPFLLIFCFLLSSASSSAPKTSGSNNSGKGGGRQICWSLEVLSSSKAAPVK